LYHLKDSLKITGWLEVLDEVQSTFYDCTRVMKKVIDEVQRETTLKEREKF